MVEGRDGGGHFSGRLTAPLVFAGSIARQILKTHNIEIFSHIYKIGKILDENIENQDLNSLRNISNKEFPTINDLSGEKMQKLIEEIRLDQNSIGGIIETMAINIPIGLGEPFFNSLESSISHLAFSIPAVKGIEFGYFKSSSNVIYSNTEIGRASCRERVSSPV